MKISTFLFAALASLSLCNTAAAQQSPLQIQSYFNFKTNTSSKASTAHSIIKDIPYFRISGIGSASTANSGDLDPSFNPYGDFTFS